MGLINSEMTNFSCKKGVICKVIDIEKKIVKLLFMNDNINRNTRTLIVSFVIAVMVLIPLRFVEVGNGLGSEVSVLGESVVSPEVKIESPYDQIDSPVPCNLGEEVDAVVGDLIVRLSENPEAAEAEEIFRVIESVEATRCE